MCECEFDYPFRWPQFYDRLLSGDSDLVASVVPVLEERDRALETHLANRCCTGAASCLFNYPSAWSLFVVLLLSGDDEKVAVALGALEDNDRALEDHLAQRPCFGTNPAVGITCEFEYPSRWREIVGPLLSGDDARVKAAVGIIEERDRVLELHLKLRVCQPIS